MFKKTVAFILVAFLAIAMLSAAEETAKTDVPQTLAEKFSYAFGIVMLQKAGQNAPYYFSVYQQQRYPELDAYYGYMGMSDFSQGKSIFTVDELNRIIKEYSDDFSARMAVKAKDNLEAAEKFLKENRSGDGIMETASGLQYKVVKQGSGEKAVSATDKVELDYELRLMDGTVTDSSYMRGSHSTFALNQVIEGFREGVMMMPMGSHYIFYIHPDLGYGTNAPAAIGPNSLLIFEVETYSIVK